MKKIVHVTTEVSVDEVLSDIDVLLWFKKELGIKEYKEILEHELDLLK